MEKRKKLMTIVILIVAGLLMISCAQRKSMINGEQVLKSIALAEVGAYKLEDYRELGLWSLTIEKEVLTVLGMTTSPLTLRITGMGTETLEIKRHKVNHALYICFIPEGISREAIEAGMIWSGTERSSRTGEGLGIEKVIVQDDELQNGTDLYEMLLTDYITLKASETSRIYAGGELIRPSYVKTSEENAYSLRRYYDARQVSPNRNTQSALEFLRDRTVEAHNGLLYFENPNRLSVTDDGREKIDIPDERDRLRQLGTEGENEVYTFSQDGDKVVFKIWSERLTNDSYKKAEKFLLSIRGLPEPCELPPTGMNGLYEGSINWTLNEELARNARFSVIMPFAGGNGTVGNPYQIANWKHLNNVRNFMASDVYFALITDLSSQTAYYGTYVATQTTPGNKGWAPIGTEANPFLGTFSGYDGAATHTITDLCIDRPGEDFVGLFGVIGTYTEGATITQLGLDDVKVTGQQYVGGLTGLIKKVEISNLSVSGIVMGERSAGGLAGMINGGELSNVAVNGTVTGGNYTGGLTGFLAGIVNNVCVIGTVMGDRDVGGLAGWISDVEVSNAYATVVVTGEREIGGFAGGLNNASISKTYTAGSVTGSFEVGGFVGEIMTGTISRSFWDIQNSGQADGVGSGSSTGITGKTTAQMKQKTTFTDADWDFDTVWTIVEEAGQISCPYLRNIPQEPAPGLESLFEGGNGTEAEPFRIANWKQLNSVRDYMGEDVHFKLITDLSSQTAHYETYVATKTTPGNKGWEPIGTVEKPFFGTFSGYDEQATHTIADLCIDRPSEDHVGLFGYVASETQGATFTHLGLKDVKVTGNFYVGGLVGLMSSGTIEDVFVSGNVSGLTGAGVLAGKTSRMNIINTYTTGTVRGGDAIGGLVGIISAGKNIINTYTNTIVSGVNWEIGGFAGTLEVENLSNVYTTGSVVGDGFFSNCVGGFVGVIYEGTYNNVYTTGSVSGNGNIGGFAGIVENGVTINQAFWDTESSGKSSGVGYGSSTGITGKTTAQMKNKTTFTDADWDFETVWTIVEEAGQISYPYLRSIPQEPAPGYEE